MKNFRSEKIPKLWKNNHFEKPKVRKDKIELVLNIVKNQLSMYQI